MFNGIWITANSPSTSSRAFTSFFAYKCFLRFSNTRMFFPVKTQRKKRKGGSYWLSPPSPRRTRYVSLLPLPPAQFMSNHQHCAWFTFACSHYCSPYHKPQLSTNDLLQTLNAAFMRNSSLWSQVMSARDATKLTFICHFRLHICIPNRQNVYHNKIHVTAEINSSTHKWSAMHGTRQQKQASHSATTIFKINAGLNPDKPILWRQRNIADRSSIQRQGHTCTFGPCPITPKTVHHISWSLRLPSPAAAPHTHTHTPHHDSRHK